VELEGSPDRGTIVILCFLNKQSLEVSKVVAAWLYTEKDAGGLGVSLGLPRDKRLIISTHVDVHDYNV
jgi:hypothetical protein